MQLLEYQFRGSEASSSGCDETKGICRLSCVIILSVLWTGAIIVKMDECGAHLLDCGSVAMLYKNDEIVIICAWLHPSFPLGSRASSLLTLDTPCPPMILASVEKTRLWVSETVPGVTMGKVISVGKPPLVVNVTLIDEVCCRSTFSSVA